MVASTDVVTIVIFRPSNQVPPREGKGGFNGIWLDPGRNKLTSAKVDKLREHSEFDAFVRAGVLEILVEDIPSNLETLEGLNVISAQKVIEVESDGEKLECWAARENQTKKRKTVLNAIANQLKIVIDGEL